MLDTTITGGFTVTCGICYKQAAEPIRKLARLPQGGYAHKSCARRAS